ncbi:hypothetical protein [Catenulispora pinisilvae]|uniref:restriction system modified-DNA reader domain-containing protein n=1 Tax=Catenulispora pinisilvae TaxID=2705253 RepID=UPI001890EB0F|nr:hypothetical protein [Catenulispora pinisilvae]
MPNIDIDTEVFDTLAARARPWRDTPNDVLRSLLDLTPVPKNDTADVPLPGQLGPLLRAGHLQPGDRLIWHRRNHATVHVVTVTASGCLALEDGSVQAGPNRAATRLAGYPTKGWTNFKTADGTSLAELAAAIDPVSDL